MISDINALLDTIQLALRNDGAKMARTAVGKALFAMRGIDDNTTQLVFEELEETAYRELQCGTDPEEVYVFLSFIYSLMNKPKDSRSCEHLLACYKRMRADGVDTRDWEECRRHIERRDWDQPAYTEEENRLAFESSLGYWRQLRLLSAYDVLLENFSCACWLTVGDGRYALEARYINKRGGVATPSDITDVTLRRAMQRGLIDKFLVEKVEHLSLADNSVDFVAAKDMLHHSSRPWQALHEMLRVSREGICFIEPFDYSHNHLTIIQKTTFGKENNYPSAWHGFENGVGNYVYSFSDREIAKFCMGRGYVFLACKGFCDCYEPKLDSEKNDPANPALQRLQAIIEDKESLACSGKGPYNLVAYIILKRVPLRSVIADFLARGFVLADLPRNKALEKVFLNHVVFANG